jgi:hypothetical protein
MTDPTTPPAPLTPEEKAKLLEEARVFIEASREAHPPRQPQTPEEEKLARLD